MEQKEKEFIKLLHMKTIFLIIKYCGLGYLPRLFIDVVRTKLLFANARLIRSPFDIRGKKYIRVGTGFTTGVGVRLDAFSQQDKVCIEIGNNVQISDYVHINSINSVIIGDNVLIGSKVFISDNNHGSYGSDGMHDDPRIPPSERPLSHSPVVIGKNVWIGEFCAVLSGVKIGEGAVIGTMSVVTKDIPPFCIAVGVPARVIKNYNFDTKRWEAV